MPSQDITLEFVGLTYDPDKMVGTDCSDPDDIGGIPYNWHFRLYDVPLSMADSYPRRLESSSAGWHNPGINIPRATAKCDGISSWPMYAVRTDLGDRYLWDLYVAPYPDSGLSPNLPITDVEYTAKLYVGEDFEQDVTYTIPYDPRNDIEFEYLGLTFDTGVMVGRDCQYPDNLGDVKGNWHFQVRNVPQGLGDLYPRALLDGLDGFWFNPSATSERSDPKCNSSLRFPMHVERVLQWDGKETLNIYVVAHRLSGTPGHGIMSPISVPKYTINLHTNLDAIPYWKKEYKLGETFAYQRDIAVRYAIEQSRNNFANFPITLSGVGSPGTNFHGSVGSGRNYSCYLSHRSGATGSSTWISEVLHEGGGLPMTNAPTNPEVCDDANIRAYEDNGWRVCPDGANPCTQYGSALRNWRDHRGIIEYFSSLPGVMKLGEISPSSVSTAVHFDDAQGLGLAGQIKANGETVLTDLFDGQNDDLDNVKSGDYIFVCLTELSDGVCPESNSSNHGFIVLGWGPVMDTLEALNFDYDNMSPVRFPEAGHVVPYIADFCFGIERETDKGTGWLQDPRPRPFYASAVLMTGSRLNDYAVYHSDYTSSNYRSRLRSRNENEDEVYQPFIKTDSTRPTWEFWQMPDSITVPNSRLYWEMP